MSFFSCSPVYPNHNDTPRIIFIIHSQNITYTHHSCLQSELVFANQGGHSDAERGV